MHTDSVERSRPKGTIPSKRPHRQVERDPVPLGRAELYTDIQPLAERVAARIAEIRRARGCGSVVFGDSEGRVYAVAESSASARNWRRRHPGWVVGEYAGTCRDGKRAGCPTAEDIADDLRAHFVDIGYVAKADLYEHIRDQEG